MTPRQWLASQDARFRAEAEALHGRIVAIVPKAPVEVTSMLGYGRGSDGFAQLAFAVRKDGLRLYGNVGVLARHKAALGRRLTGKSCVTLKRADELDEALLRTIVRESLAADRITAE